LFRDRDPELFEDPLRQIDQPGAPSILDCCQREALREVVENGPTPAIHGVVRWRLSRELRAMGFRKISARSRHHAQDREAAGAFKKNFSAIVDEIAANRHRGRNHNAGNGWPAY
jgi:hypothetical protein